ncbi:MAG TPA: SMP-30/gluconolactonase/LRE family protein [Spirochaetia bacterium]|nr:SMP-30/gluconolactonase/LRE family protein [Spirochaetia bacterium]
MMRAASLVPEIVADHACRLGSGPAWHPGLGILTWIDAHDRSLHSYDPAGAKSSRVPIEEKVSQCLPSDSGRALLVTADGVLKTLHGSDLKTLGVRLPWPADSQLCWVASDHSARLYCATRTKDGTSGSVYQVAADGGVKEMLRDLGRVTGLGFDHERELLYCCDAESREILRFAFHAAVGEFSDRTTVVRLPHSLGAPHGIAVDAKGFVWVPMWGGSCVMRFAPTGKEERRIYFTAKLLSGLAFGGSDLRDLFVVSSGAEDRHVNGPGAGALYRVRPAVKGAVQPLATIT